MTEDKKITDKGEQTENKKDSSFIIVLTLFIVFTCILPNCDGPKKTNTQPVPTTQIEKTTTKKTTTNTIKQQPQVKPINTTTTTPTKIETSNTTTKYSDYDDYYDDTWYIYEGEEGREYHLDDE